MHATFCVANIFYNLYIQNFIKVYFMKLLSSYRDVVKYAVTKWTNRIMLRKHLVLETAGIWPFMCYLLFVSTAEMSI